MDLSRGGFLSLVPQLVRDPCWTICHPYFYQDILRTINKSVIAAWTGWNLNVRSMSRSPLRSTSVGQWNVSVLYLLLYLRRCGTELRLHKQPDITGKKKKSYVAIDLYNHEHALTRTSRNIVRMISLTASNLHGTPPSFDIIMCRHVYSRNVYYF